MNRKIVAFPENHSDEVQEIIDSPPNWLLMWGITMSFFLIIMLAAGTSLIQYPDIVTVPFSLTAHDSPKTIIVRIDGKLNKILVTDGQYVTQDQPIAYSESIGDHVQILRLDETIKTLRKSIEKGNWDLLRTFPASQFIRIGEVQADFELFIQKLTTLQTYLNNGFYIQKKKLLENDYKDLTDMEKVITEQLTMQVRDYELAKEEFQTQEKLYEAKVISSLEFKKEKGKLLAREMPLKSLAASVIQNRSAQTAKRKEQLELQNTILEQKSNFHQALHILQNNIESWKQKYVLIAPVAGKVSFSGPWQEQQHLVAGQNFAKIEPRSGTYEGLIKIPQYNIGKIREGQRVLIKLNGFPYREYGMLSGKLSYLSPTPNIDSIYWGYVKLPNQLITKYGRLIPYRNGLNGSAEIVTMDRTLAQRLLATIYQGGQ